VDFISYRDDLRGQIKRRARTPPDPVLLTLRLESGATDSGTAVALVFVPRDYEP
jgi:hypothetical protein